VPRGHLNLRPDPDGKVTPAPDPHKTKTNRSRYQESSFRSSSRCKRSSLRQGICVTSGSSALRDCLASARLQLEGRGLHGRVLCLAGRHQYSHLQHGLPYFATDSNRLSCELLLLGCHHLFLSETMDHWGTCFHCNGLGQRARAPWTANDTSLRPAIPSRQRPEAVDVCTRGLCRLWIAPSLRCPLCPIDLLRGACHRGHLFGEALRWRHCISYRNMYRTLWYWWGSGRTYWIPNRDADPWKHGSRSEYNKCFDKLEKA
jgi:hypothetical protein